MSSEKILGVLFDPARLVFRHEWYTKLLPDLARWGFNTMVLNLADDRAGTIQLHRRPDLTSPHAFGQDKIRRLVRQAAKHGIQVIPLMPAFGHTGYIHRRPRYQHLGHGDGRRYLCPANPETYEVMRDVMEEVMELFPSPWFHVGLDEFGRIPDLNCPLCRKEFGAVPRWQVYVRHVQWLRDLLAAHGRRMMMWNEFPRGPWKPAEVAEALPKDIVLTIENDRPEETRFHLDHGFDLIRSFPYLLSYPGTTILPHAGNLDFQPWSVDTEAHASRILGTISPVWENTYALFGTATYAIAHAADQLRAPGGTPGFGRAFCEGYFGVADGTALADILERQHRHAPVFRRLDFENGTYTMTMMAGRLVNLFDDDTANELTAADVAYGREFAEQAKAVGQGLRRERPAVTRNVRVLDAYILAADLAAHIGGRGDLMAGVTRDLREADEAARAGEGSRAQRLRVGIWRALRRAAIESRRLLERAYRNFDWGYYPDHPAKHSFLPPASGEGSPEMDQVWYFYGGNGSILASLHYSTRYLEQLAREAEGLAAGKRTMPGLAARTG
ncbi:MAG: family 20 glycosylhydrolase [Armatimonadetes bacterium]|nr:family 20 glycosylhydrolase [Armatimonadota bacterium]